MKSRQDHPHSQNKHPPLRHLGPRPSGGGIESVIPLTAEEVMPGLRAAPLITCAARNIDPCNRKSAVT